MNRQFAATDEKPRPRRSVLDLARRFQDNEQKIHYARVENDRILGELVGRLPEVAQLIKTLGDIQRLVS